MQVQPCNKNTKFNCHNKCTKFLGQPFAICAKTKFSQTSRNNSTRPNSTSDNTEYALPEAGNIRKQNVSQNKLNNLKVIKRSNKPNHALNLPTITNINPRSVYNKVKEFHTFVEQEEIDIVFMSESWERESETLQDIIKLENHDVFSNVYQRKGIGGRPALIVDKRKFDVQNLTNTVLNIKWGVEIVWCLLTPKNATTKSKIQKIACASVYCKPGSKNKTDLQDHIAEAYNLLKAKYQKGLHFIIAGDTNELNISPILDLSPHLKQIVKLPTRKDPVTGVEKILDPVITTLSALYKVPQCLPPLDADPGTKGKTSDHRIVVVRPIRSIDNQCARYTRDIKVRPITESGINLMRTWCANQNWKDILEAESADEKAANLQQMLLRKFHETFPEKTHRVSTDDQPWINHKLKLLDRKRKREYNRHRKSEKWNMLDKQFKENVKSAKSIFYQKIVGELTSKDTKQWYSSLKRMTAYDQQNTDNVIIQEISHLSDHDQATKLAEHFSEIPNEYDQLQKEDIDISPISSEDIPQFKMVQIWEKLTQLNPNKSTV